MPVLHTVSANGTLGGANHGEYQFLNWHIETGISIMPPDSKCVSFDRQRRFRHLFIGEWYGDEYYTLPLGKYGFPLHLQRLYRAEVIRTKAKGTLLIVEERGNNDMHEAIILINDVWQVTSPEVIYRKCFGYEYVDHHDDNCRHCGEPYSITHGRRTHSDPGTVPQYNGYLGREQLMDEAKENHHVHGSSIEGVSNIVHLNFYYLLRLKTGAKLRLEARANTTVLLLHWDGKQLNPQEEEPK